MQKVLIGKEIEQRCSEHSKHLADKINIMEAKYELEIANKIDRKEFENRMSKAMSKNNDNMACSRQEIHEMQTKFNNMRKKW